jgi:hypothetical protein
LETLKSHLRLLKVKNGYTNAGLTSYLAELIIQLQQMGHTAAVIGQVFSLQDRMRLLMPISRKATSDQK